MALRSSVHKVDLHIADNNRAYYGSHSLTVARHPSETDERMMVRLLTYALLANEDDSLSFTRGLSESDEPALWRKDMTGAIRLWVETGLPDDRRVLKACGKADEVVVISYGRNAGLWWQGVQNKLGRAQNLRVYVLDTEGTTALATMAGKKIELNINIQDDSAWISNEAGEATVQIQVLR